jgi:hypothetical protein
MSAHLYVNFKIFCYNIFNNLATVPQSVRYHKLPPPSILRPAISQARLYGVLDRNSMYETFLAKTLLLLVKMFIEFSFYIQ